MEDVIQESDEDSMIGISVGCIQEIVPKNAEISSTKLIM